MNRAKFTMGATAFALAIAGAFATKASNKVRFAQAYTYNGAQLPNEVTCASSQLGLLCKTNGVSGRTLFTAPGKADNSLIQTLRTAFVSIK